MAVYYINTMEEGKQNNTYRILFYRCVVIDRYLSKLFIEQIVKKERYRRITYITYIYIYIIFVSEE